MDSLSTYLAIAIFIAAGTTIAWASKRFLKKEAKDFYTAGGRFGTILASFSYAATTYSAFMFIGLVGLSYASGVGTLGFELVYFMGTLFLLYYIAPKYWLLHKKFGFISPAEVMSERYGSRSVGAIVTLVSLIALIPYSTSQIIGVAFAAEGASGGAVPFTSAVLIAVVVALLWSVIAGIWSVGWTDVFQGLIMITAGVAVLIWTFIWGTQQVAFDLARLGSLTYVPNQFWTFQNFVNMTLPWFFFAITNPQVVQRLFAPKSENAQRGMIIWFGVYGLFFTLLVVTLGLLLSGFTVEGIFPSIAYRDSVTPTLLGMMPFWLSTLGLVAVIAASVSTIDGIILTLSSMAARDLFRAYLREEKPGAEVLVGRLTIGTLALLCTAFALSRPGFIVDLAVLSSSLLLPQAPVVIGMFAWKRGGKWAASSAVVSGFAAAAIMYFLKVSPLGVPSNVWTMAVASAVYIAVALMEKPTVDAKFFGG